MSSASCLPSPLTPLVWPATPAAPGTRATRATWATWATRAEAAPAVMRLAVPRCSPGAVASPVADAEAMDGHG